LVSTQEAAATVPSTSPAVNLLWTGGWDSTFRLLQLLWLQHRRVQPVYLIDPGRRSTAVEIETMQKIRDRLRREPAATADLLLPTRLGKVAELRPDAELAQAFQTVRATRFMGSQYDWLARYCKQNRLDRIELCIHRDDKAHPVLEPFICEIAEVTEVMVTFDERHAGTAEHALFRYFAYPLFHLSKKDMAEEARARGWTEIMCMTWFCHEPRGGRRPCGVCNPCVYTIEEGLGWRLPLRSWLAYCNRKALVAATRQAHRVAGWFNLDWR
jgi:7-cyano-7-deazaguanine synthase in queuosine biosynthesis